MWTVKLRLNSKSCKFQTTRSHVRKPQRFYATHTPAKCKNFMGKVAKYDNSLLGNCSATTCELFSFSSICKNIICDPSRARHPIKPIASYNIRITTALGITAGQYLMSLLPRRILQQELAGGFTKLQGQLIPFKLSWS